MYLECPSRPISWRTNRALTLWWPVADSRGTSTVGFSFLCLFLLVLYLSFTWTSTFKRRTSWTRKTISATLGPLALTTYVGHLQCKAWFATADIEHFGGISDNVRLTLEFPWLTICDRLPRWVMIATKLTLTGDILRLASFLPHDRALWHHPPRVQIKH